jgi:hypothetical protein
MSTVEASNDAAPASIEDREAGFNSHHGPEGDFDFTDPSEVESVAEEAPAKAARAPRNTGKAAKSAATSNSPAPKAKAAGKSAAAAPAARQRSSTAAPAGGKGRAAPAAAPETTRVEHGRAIEYDDNDDIESDGVDVDPNEAAESETVETNEAEFADRDDAEQEGDETGDDREAAKPKRRSAERNGQAEAEGESDIDAEFASLAADYGYTPEDAAAFGTPENFKRAMSVLDRELAGLGKKMRTGQAPPESDAADAADEAEEVPATTAQRSAATPSNKAPGADRKAAAEAPDARLPSSDSVEGRAFEKFKLDLDPVEFGEETVQKFSKLVDHFNTQMERLAAENGELKQHFGRVQQMESQRIADEFVEDMDRFFESQAEEYGDVFGRGTRSDLDPKSEYFKARNAFVEQMNDLAAGELQRTGKIPSRAKLRERALRVFEPTFKKLEQNVRGKIAGQVDKRTRLGLRRPSQRTAPVAGKTGDQRAANFANQFTRERGLDVFEEDDGLDGEI